MAFIESLLQRLGYIKASTFSPPIWLRESADTWPIPDYQLAAHQAELYPRLSWVNISVSTVAQTAAGTRLSIKKRSSEKLDDVENHPFEMLLQHPNPLQSRFELLESTVAHYRLTGNAYWWLNRLNENSPPAEVWMIPPSRMKPVPDGNMGLRGYLFDTGTGRQELPLEPWEVVHFKSFNPVSLYVGLSPIEALATVAIGDLAMQKWNTNHFAKDNAKPQGILAYADNINDTDWAKMKHDMLEQHGGTKRRLMMMRNVGKGGVEWVATNVSQKDMEFLAGRTFNKEEIFSVFAPGLASMLAVNATEANSRTGKATLMDMVVYPALSAMAEKITNDVLPAYGEDLVAEFDDVRVADRMLELQEQQAFERVHTVAEVREKFYGDQPLGDDRDNLLIAEVGKAALGGEEPEPTPPALMPFAGQQDEEHVPPGDGDEEDSTEEAEEIDAESVKAELKTWQRFATSRMKAGKAMREFQTEHVPPALKASIEGALESAQTVSDVHHIFADAQRWADYP